MQRLTYILSIMFATILMAVQASHAQVYPPGYQSWPMDSVINRSVHQYTVQGDVNYTTPSKFVWLVYGGTLYLDEQATLLAGNGITDTLSGNALNQTSLWVKWDGFNTPRDTGFVYLHEISSDNCQYEVNDPHRYSGLRIKVSAPPDVRFIANATNLCSYDTSTMVIVQIKGMPPFDLKYSINGKIDSMHVQPEDLLDWDQNDTIDNIAFLVNGFNGTTVPITHVFELLEASSGGVKGKVLPNYPRQTVNIYPAPPAPEIVEEFTQVTYMLQHQYQLGYLGENPSAWYWELYNADSQYVASHEGKNWLFDNYYDPGQYFFTNRYIDEKGCYSPYDTLWFEIFDLPTIGFSDETPDNLGNCSSVHRLLSDKYLYLADMQFDFKIEYTGATYYEFTWRLTDYKGTTLKEETVSYYSLREFWIYIQHTLENTELPPENRIWTVEILKATNYEGVEVQIIDALRRIQIHPKPQIMEDIEFAN